MKICYVDKLKEVLHNDKQLSSYNGIPKEVFDLLIKFIDANSIDVEAIENIKVPEIEIEHGTFFTVPIQYNGGGFYNIYIAKRKEDLWIAR